jgi:hypothetical protein
VWHTTANLGVPDNISPIFLPSRAPELNPVENVWQYLRANALSNRVFAMSRTRDKRHPFDLGPQLTPATHHVVGASVSPPNSGAVLRLQPQDEGSVRQSRR